MASLRKYLTVTCEKVCLLCTHQTIIIYSTVGWSIASISDLGGIFTLALRASVNMVPWLYIWAMDLSTVLYIICILGLSDSAFFTITIVAKAIFTIFDSITIVY